MPRGVYDRSKSKAQRATEKAAAPAQAAAPKKKYTKKALVSAKAELVEKIQNVGQVAGSDVLKAYEPLLKGRTNLFAGALRLLSEIRPALSGSNATAAVDTLLNKVVAEYSKELFPPAVQEAVEVAQVAAPSIGNGAPVPAPVAVAPVPFNPPTFAPTPAQS